MENHHELVDIVSDNEGGGGGGAGGGTAGGGQALLVAEVSYRLASTCDVR